MKPVLMIHEIHPEIFDLPLEKYILTFDDALYGQYLHLEEFKKVPTQKIYFVSTGIVCPEDQSQSNEFISCQEAHRRFFETGNTSHYMKWSQILEISQTENCEIGGHSHMHLRHDGKGLKTIYEDIRQDTEAMFSAFNERGIDIECFCFPYNKKYFLYEEQIKKRGISRIYGDERIRVEDLL